MDDHFDQKDAQLLWQTYLNKKGKAWLNIKSGSMGPLLPVGYSVLVEKCTFEKIRVFDIVVFTSNERFIVHRVLKKYKNGILQSGDAIINPSYTGKDQIIGRVVFIKSPTLMLKMDKKTSILLNAMISVLNFLALKSKNHNYWILKVRNKLFFSLKRMFNCKS